MGNLPGAAARSIAATLGLRTAFGRRPLGRAARCRPGIALRLALRLAFRRLLFRFRLLRRPQHGAAALWRTAAAGIDLVDVGRIVLLAADLVVVAQLLPRLDVARRVDEHAAVLDHRLAVACALVIDEARVVAADPRVDD